MSEEKPPIIEENHDFTAVKPLYHTASHSKYLIKMHMIFVCKYRKKLLQGLIDEDIKQMFMEISKMPDTSFSIEVMESDLDHLHLLLDMEPTVTPVAIVNRLKSISTNRIWKRHEAYLKEHFWKEKTFWSDGYFVCSTENANQDTIRAYIEQQG